MRIEDEAQRQASFGCANARALAERLGMKLEEEFKQVKFFHSRGWDVVVYAISKNEWHNS